MPESTAKILQNNLADVRSDIDAACTKAGREAESVQLVAVTKYADWSWVQQLNASLQDFGENRPQQLIERSDQLPSANWHLIGQLQRNKVRSVLPHVSLIHSVDSFRLLTRIQQLASEIQLTVDVLLQVNVTGEHSKSGFGPEQLAADWDQVLQYHDVVRIRGLMTMAAASDNPEDARPAFATLRSVRDQLQQQSDRGNASVQLTELSMGMSGDFAVAIEEGATIVRVGSRLFKGLERSSDSNSAS